jgi:hypothetical protein
VIASGEVCRERTSPFVCLHSAMCDYMLTVLHAHVERARTARPAGAAQRALASEGEGFWGASPI